MRPLPVGEHGLLDRAGQRRGGRGAARRTAAPGRRRHAAAGARDRPGRPYGAPRRPRRPPRARSPNSPAGTFRRATAGDRPAVEIPVRYDGPDLADVAALWGVTPDEVVRRALRHRVPRRLLRLRPRLRLSDRTARAAARTAPGHAAHEGPGRLGRAGRPVHRCLPALLPRRLAADRHHRHRPVGPAPRTGGAAHARHPCPLRPAGDADDRPRLLGRPGRCAHHRPGSRQARPRPPRGAARRRARRARAPPRQPPGRQPRVGRHAGDHAHGLRPAGPYGHHRRRHGRALPGDRRRPPRPLGRPGPRPGGRRPGRGSCHPRSALPSRLRRGHRHRTGPREPRRRSAVRPGPRPAHRRRGPPPGRPARPAGRRRRGRRTPGR